MRRASWAALAMGVGGGLFPCLGVAGAGAAQTDTGSPGSDACRGKSGPTSPNFTKSVTVDGTTYTSDPGGLTLNPGQTVGVTLSWAPSLFDGTPDEAWDCVFLGEPGTLGGTDLDQPRAHHRRGRHRGHGRGGFHLHDTFERPATADPFMTSFTARAAWSGRTVCDRGQVLGRAEGENHADWVGNDDRSTVRSNQFCFFVNPGARVPEAPWSALLLLPAVALTVGVVILRWRRGAAATA